eukprot:2214-Heterococcus_DN1.PRE.1
MLATNGITSLFAMLLTAYYITQCPIFAIAASCLLSCCQYCLCAHATNQLTALLGKAWYKQKTYTTATMQRNAGRSLLWTSSQCSLCLHNKHYNYRTSTISLLLCAVLRCTAIHCIRSSDSDTDTTTAALRSFEYLRSSSATNSVSGVPHMLRYSPGIKRELRGVPLLTTKAYHYHHHYYHSYCMLVTVSTASYTAAVSCCVSKNRGAEPKHHVFIPPRAQQQHHCSLSHTLHEMAASVSHDTAVASLLVEIQAWLLSTTVTL